MPYEWSEIGQIGPEMILVAVASTTPLMWVFSKRDNRWAYLALTLVGAVFAAGILVGQWPQESESILSGQLVIDQFSVFLRLVLVAVAAAAVVLGLGNLPKVRFGAYAAILLFSTTGMMLLVGANDLVVMFVALELMSIPIYALVAITRWRQRSTEGAIKYFTMGALSTAVTAYGVGWLYGVTGETSFAEIGAVFAQREIGPPEFLAIGLIIAALSFKIALVPFHAWTPDAYDGAPTAVTAFISVAPKIAALGLLLRLLAVSFEPYALDLEVLLGILAAITIVAGNLIAVAQTNVKRMLAYSSIAHSGYMLAGLVATQSQVGGGLTYAGTHTLLYYAVAYALMNTGAFAVVMLVERYRAAVDLEAYRGLGRSSPALALAMAVFMLSLIGVPPTAGFFGKLLIIDVLVNGGAAWLAILLVLAAVVSAFYYLRVVVNMYMRPADPDAARVSSPDAVGAVLATTAIGTIVVGIWSGWLLELANAGSALAAV
ncbi:MAG: NADH-quinone oxidoreductase subunit N [Chloroflexi bacterium]|nr:NADH-quinone oxidoreductase subunit N [Chloroflexota bacterium]MXW28542.1 NADH-quinone oxidoreductase subunit N [Chloroflexota bacterium]MYC48631.1 NADH-quinone oxidoreductase subunit N [Chloroflexota bacterium]